MIHTWALVLFFHVGLLGDTDSNATSVVPGFSSLELCQKAAKQVQPLVSGTKKQVRAVCVQTQ